MKILLTKILRKLKFTPVTIHNTKVECTQVGTSYEYTYISGMDNYNIIAVYFVVHEVTQMVYFVRSVENDICFTDAPSGGRYRGTIKPDWANSQIGIRCISAGTSGTHYNTVYFKGVYGIA